MRTVIIPIERTAGMTRRQAETQAVATALAELGFTGYDHKPDGAPWLPENPHVNISITHSRTHAAVAVAPAGHPAFGIDIEQPRTRLLDVAARFLSLAENADIGTDIHKLLRAWTAKEAVFKALRLPGVDFARDIELDTVNFVTAVYKPTTALFRLEYTAVEPDQLLCTAIMDVPQQ